MTNLILACYALAVNNSKATCEMCEEQVVGVKHISTTYALLVPREWRQFVQR